MSLPFFNSSIISGSTAHNLGGCGGGCLPVGGWVELGRTTLACAGDDITVSCLADKRYYQILFDGIGCGIVRGDIRLNCDTCNNYSSRNSSNGVAACPPDTSTSSMNKFTNGDSYANLFGVGYLSNISTKEKLFIGHSNNNKTGVTNVPDRREMVGKHAQTSNPINAINVWQQSTGSWNTGSEVVVLGWDESDTHTTNFWQELASVNATSGDNLSSGTFTAKKYLWIQMYMKYTSTGGVLHETFNNDTCSNYASRDSYDGGVDGTSTCATHIDWDRGVQDTYYFVNQFIINNASKEKLAIGHQLRIDSTETGAGTAPHRSERVDKWANTSNQITEIDFDNTTGGIDISNGWLKVWGAD